MSKAYLNALYEEGTLQDLVHWIGVLLEDIEGVVNKSGETPVELSKKDLFNCLCSLDKIYDELRS